MESFLPQHGRMVSAHFDSFAPVSMSGHRYKSTNVFDWNPAEKHAELFDSSSRFLLVAEEGTALEANLAAFSMFRFDTEENMDGREENVLYWCMSFSSSLCRPLTVFDFSYELQVSEASRGLGIGKTLVSILQKLSREWCMTKIMLTVFRGWSFTL